MLCITILFGIIALAVSSRVEDPLVYLYKYGYLSTGRSSSSKNLTAAIMSFQNIASLPQTGNLDSTTMAMMERSRCGVKDFAVVTYGGVGTTWKTNRLTYKISTYTKDLPQFKQRQIIRDAYKLWSNVSPLTFTEKAFGKVHMEIKFVRGSHGDGEAFDGPGGTIGHGFYPLIGDIHFDDDETYVEGRTNKAQTFTLLYVAAHEIGHALGLGHDTSGQSSLMAPFYSDFGVHPDAYNLHQNDINGIQGLYGAKPLTTRRPTRRTTVKPVTRRLTRRPTTKPKQRCVDTGRLCGFYANQRNCQNNSYIIKRCKKSCNRC